jgi:hypothetical protein
MPEKDPPAIADDEEKHKKSNAGRPRKTEEDICYICGQKFSAPSLMLNHQKNAKHPCDWVTKLKIEGDQFICKIERC